MIHIRTQKRECILRDNDHMVDRKKDRNLIEAE